MYYTNSKNKSKNFCASNDIINRIEKQPTEWGKIFAIINLIRDLYLDYLKNSYNSTTDNPLKN